AVLLPSSQPAHPPLDPVPSPPLHKTTEWSPTLQNVLDQPSSKLPIQLVIAGLVFSCGFAVWVWLGRIQEVSYAQGQLVPEGEVYKVQPTVQGEIAQIAVAEGDRVKAGQVIAVLDERLAETEVARLEQSLMAYQLQLVKTQGLTEKTRLELETRRAIAQAKTQAQEVAINQMRISTATNQTILHQLEDKTTAYEARLARLQPLVEAGAIAYEFVFDAEQALQEQYIATTRSQGDLQQTQEEARRLQAELIQQRAEGRQSELEIQQQLQQLAVQTDELHAKITETESLLKAAKTQLGEMYLYAPVAGTVSSLGVRNIGEVAQSGQTIAEIAPDGVPLVLSATLPDRESGFVKVGMPVQVKFDAFPFQEHGVVTGEVVSISPDAIVDDHQEALYEVEIALKQKTTRPNQTLSLKAGQTATAEILTRERRIIDVLLDPIKKLQQDGMHL
ncbi:MAG: HlyD family efflux transporter periplasmic adaptor subunit, partial [Leptolyngbyaceae cyanobacterium SL_7_1]|nr:HlyD family efflux transporter periplasmic adaptor subunit [Leptolyngbyaceae cyanobacterium SL_7_1]